MLKNSQLIYTKTNSKAQKQPLGSEIRTLQNFKTNPYG